MLNNEQLTAAASSPLFKNIAEQDISKLLQEMRVFPVPAAKNEILIEQGERRSPIHIVLSGAAVGERLSPDGGRTVINEFPAGSLFGDMLSGGEEKSPVAVRMLTDGELLKIPFVALLAVGEGSADVREAALRNLFREISGKYFALMRRIDMLLRPTLRGKLAAYLLAQAQGRESFTSPHSREQQAEILCCDRSALSRELSRMRSERIIDFSGARFKMLDSETLTTLAEK